MNLSHLPVLDLFIQGVRKPRVFRIKKISYTIYSSSINHSLVGDVSFYDIDEGLQFYKHEKVNRASIPFVPPLFKYNSITFTLYICSLLILNTTLF